MGGIKGLGAAFQDDSECSFYGWTHPEKILPSYRRRKHQRKPPHGTKELTACGKDNQAPYADGGPIIASRVQGLGDHVEDDG